ncbi:MAG TPA: Na-translocating system protein MpsC family protein [Baekduia sp.]|nr:Na-translocating system protein MpsC family protein [Baekduia sp.]
MLLEDTLTPAERNLVRLGEQERLRETRLFFQHASIREFCQVIERLTGRRVRAFTSAIDAEVDGLSVETFILHPDGFDGPSRAEIAPE